MALIFILTFILPLAGAIGILGLSLVPRIRPYVRYVTLALVSLTTILVFTLRWADPVVVTPTLWKPLSLFGAVPILQNDVTVQPMALALMLAACGATLVGPGRMEASSSRLVVSLLALLPAGFVSLWAANPLTMIIGWAFYDLLQAVGRLSAGGSARTVIREIVCGSVATLFLWGGVVLSYSGSIGELWMLINPGRVSLTLWVVAGVLRLWVYPFHLATPDDLDPASPLAVLLLLGPVTGWGLWLRLASMNGGSIFGDAWVLALAAATIAVGGFLAWSCKAPRFMLPWVGMGMTGTVLLGAAMAGENAAAVIVAGGVAWILGVAVLFLSDGLRGEAVWWALPSLVGTLALMGIPLTLGFVAESTLIGALIREGRLAWIGAFFVGNLFLAPALVRWLRSSFSPGEGSSPAREEGIGGVVRIVTRGVGLGLPASLLVVAGLYPPLLIGKDPAWSLGALFTRPGLAGWLLWAISLVGGGVLAWQERNLRPKIELILSAAHDLLRLDWLYDAVVSALDRGLSVLQMADDLVGGAGALLWSWLLFLIIILAWSSR